MRASIEGWPTSCLNTQCHGRISGWRRVLVQGYQRSSIVGSQTNGGCCCKGDTWRKCEPLHDRIGWGRSGWWWRRLCAQRAIRTAWFAWSCRLEATWWLGQWQQRVSSMWKEVDICNALYGSNPRSSTKIACWQFAKSCSESIQYC